MTQNGRPLNVLLLLENHVYPLDVRVKPHAEALVTNGYKVTVISPGRKDYPSSEVINGVRVYRYPAIFAEKSKLAYILEYSIAIFFLTVLTLWVWMRHGLDILLYYNPPDIMWIVGLLPKLFGKTLIFDIRDLSPELFASKFARAGSLPQKVLTWMERVSCRTADRVVVTNETSRKLIYERNGLDPQRVAVIRQGPDIEAIYPVEPDPEVRSRGEVIIGYLGNMSPERGIGNLLYALHHLQYDLGYTNWSAVLIGRPTTALDLNKLAAELGIAERVWVTGFQSQERWVSMLSGTDICVDPGASNPGNDVSTTNKIMDYMALAKPVVAFNLAERYGTAGETALYAQDKDNLDLARQIAKLIDDPEKRVRMGAAGYEKVQRQLAWQHQRRLLLALFGEVTSEMMPVKQKQTSQS